MYNEKSFNHLSIANLVNSSLLIVFNYQIFSNTLEVV